MRPAMRGLCCHDSPHMFMSSLSSVYEPEIIEDIIPATIITIVTPIRGERGNRINYVKESFGVRHPVVLSFIYYYVNKQSVYIVSRNTFHCLKFYQQPKILVP